MQALASHFDELATADQLGILNDTRSLALAGRVPMREMMALIKRVNEHADPLVQLNLFDQLQELNRVYQGLPTQAAFQRFARNALQSLFKAVTWDKQSTDGPNTATLRAEVILTLADMNDVDIITEAKKRFAAYLSDERTLDAETRHVVLSIAAKYADQAIFDALHTLARNAKTEIERAEMYEWMASADDVQLTAKALELTISAEPPKPVLANMVNAAAYWHPDMAFDFASAHWAQVSQWIEPTDGPRYAPSLIAWSTAPAPIAKLQAFAAKNIPANARQDTEKAIASVRYRISIREQRLPEVDAWLAQ
jgi:aminopeptidase N